ncbi:unnamed protein product, partial [Cyprideis torosa]
KATGQWLTLLGYEVDSFGSALEALEELSADRACVVVSDIRMPGMDGLELARRCKALDPDLPVILVTAHGDISMAVQAMRDGVYDFLEKPYEPTLLSDRIQRAWEKRQLVLENRKLRRIVDQGASLEHRIIGYSAVVKLLRQQVIRLAETPVDMIINGETGTGKELVARCLHEWSSRNAAPFVAVNCGAIPEHLFESELFGHEAGAFTGASKRRIGKLEYAHGGVLFLDEIESMPLSFQIKLLRVLQERKLERLGSNQQIDLDLWVIAATKVNLRQASDRGEFREDLYYRFNIAELQLPPLRERREDVPLLFDYFAHKAAIQFERNQPPLDEDGTALLMSHPWQGNVRELKNAAERWVLGVQSPPNVATLMHIGVGEDSSSRRGLSAQVQRFEKQLIIESLRRNGGKVQAVLEELDLPRRTLNNKMVQYGIQREAFMQFHWKIPRVILMAGTVFLSVSAEAESPPAGPPPAAVVTQTMQPRDVPVRFEYVGQVAGSREVDIRARVTGVVEKKLYKEGSRV